MTRPDLPITAFVDRTVLVVGMNQRASEVRAALANRGSRFAVVRQGTRVTAVVDRCMIDRVLAAGRGDALVRDTVHPGAVSLRADARAATAARIMRRIACAALPVLDEHHALLGLVTADDLAAATRDEPADVLDGAAGRQVERVPA